MSSNEIFSLEDQARLNLTLNTRHKIISELTEGNKIPQGEEDRSLLMKALDGMDRTILARAKIKSDDTAAKNAQETAKTVAELLLRLNHKQSNNVRQEEPHLPNDTIELIDGETFIGVQPVSYSEIMKDN